MSPWSNAVAAIVVLITVAPKAGADFVPGHIYVAATSPEGCFLPFYANDRVWDINPVTGESSILGEVPDEMCGFMQDVDFTPDGTGLRTAERFTNTVLEFNGDGDVSVALRASDGLMKPESMAYDAQGNLYVTVVSPPRILKFATDGGAATVFADESDGVGSTGPLAFGSDGNLYYANVSPGHILRFSPDGEGELFDTVAGAILSLTADTQGHLFVLTGGLFRYDVADPDSQELIASDFFSGSFPASITMSFDQGSVYVAADDRVLAIDALNGGVSLVAEVPVDPLAVSWFGTGVAVYVPEPSGLAGSLVAAAWLCLRRPTRKAGRSSSSN